MFLFSYIVLLYLIQKLTVLVLNNGISTLKFSFQTERGIEKYQKDILVRGVIIVVFIWMVLLAIEISVDNVLRIYKLF